MMLATPIYRSNLQIQNQCIIHQQVQEMLWDMATQQLYFDYLSAKFDCKNTLHKQSTGPYFSLLFAISKLSNVAL